MEAGSKNVSFSAVRVCFFGKLRRVLAFPAWIYPRFCKVHPDQASVAELDRENPDFCQFIVGNLAFLRLLQKFFRVCLRHSSQIDSLRENIGEDLIRVFFCISENSRGDHQCGSNAERNPPACMLPLFSAGGSQISFFFKIVPIVKFRSRCFGGRSRPDFVRLRSRRHGRCRWNLSKRGGLRCLGRLRLPVFVDLRLLFRGFFCGFFLLPILSAVLSIPAIWRRGVLRFLVGSIQRIVIQTFPKKGIQISKAVGILSASQIFISFIAFHFLFPCPFLRRERQISFCRIRYRILVVHCHR